MSKSERVFFHFSFANGQCVKLNRDGGMRLIIDVPECDKAAVDEMSNSRDKLFFAGVQVDNDGNTNPTAGEEKSGGEKASRRAWP